MAQPERHHEFATWHVPGKTPLIVYSQAVMLRLVEDAGLAMGRMGGGEAVGGILFGLADDGEIRITAYRAVSRVRRSPEFRLTEDEETILQHMLQTANSDPELRKLVPVGWYHSNLNEPVALSADDLELWKRQFPFRWQIALVLRPQVGGPTKAGFFFRPEKGHGRFDSSMREFEIVPAAAEPDTVGDPLERAPETMVPEAPTELFDVPAERTPRRTLWYGLGALGLVAVVACGAWLASKGPAAPTRAKRASQVKVSDKDGYLTVEWDPNSPEIQSIVRPHLEIADGERRSTLPLTGVLLRAGRWSVARTSGDVRVRLASLDERNALLVLETVRYIAPVSSQVPVGTVTAELASRQQRLDDLQASIAERAALNEKLEERLAELRASRRPGSVAPEPVTRPELPPQTQTAPVAVAIPPPVVRPSEPTPDPVVPSPAPPAPEPPRYTGPRSGRIIWTGHLPPNSALSIDGRRASAGSVTAAFPGVPVRVSAYPADIAGGGLSVYTPNASRANSTEGRSAQTGWMNTTFVFDAARARDVLIAEGPSAASPQRIVLRSGERAVSAVVIEWQVAQ